MGTLLHFTTQGRERPTEARSESVACEIVIFPGVRIERHDRTIDPDAGDPSGSGNLDGTSGRRRSRKSS